MKLENFALISLYLFPLIALVFIVNVIDVIKRFKQKELTLIKMFWMACLAGLFLFPMVWIMTPAV